MCGHTKQQPAPSTDVPNIKADPTSDTALTLLLSHAGGNCDILCAFFASLPPPAVACFSRVCRDWAHAAEYCLQAACQNHRWAKPRRARLQQRGVLAQLPWRTLFMAKACRSCLSAPGDFAVRTLDAGAPRCFLCAACAKQSRTVERMQRANLTLDVTGLSGKMLFSAKESKFCSEVSKLSKQSQDNASGARADVLRKAGIGRRR